MPHLVSVDVVQSIEQHLHDLLDFCQGELYISIAQQASQVMLTEVKHQVDAAFVSVELSSFKNNDRKKKIKPSTSLRQTCDLENTHKVMDWGHVIPTFSSADLNQIDHILMFEQLQDLDLSQSCDWELKQSNQRKLYEYLGLCSHSRAETSNTITPIQPK